MSRLKKCLVFAVCMCLLISAFSGCSRQTKEYTSLDQLNSSEVTIASWNGAPIESALKEQFPEANAVTYDSISVLITYLKGNKVDAVFSSRIFYDTFPNKEGLKILGGNLSDSYYSFFFANNEKGKKLRDEMNEFIIKAEETGLRSELEKIWLGEKIIGREIGTGCDDPNAPELVFAVEYESPPFGYVENGKCMGFDVDYAECFCKEYGYRFKAVGLPFSMISSGDVTGAFDFAGGALQTDEKLKESKVLSDPHYDTPYVTIVRSGENSTGILTSLRKNLSASFIEEDRWKMYAGGLLSTLIISVFATCIGTLLGFLIYLIDMKGGRIFRRFVKLIFTVVHITPVVVLLMIFYHIVFHGFDISGLMVSVVVFTLIMTGSVFNLMTSSVNTIDKGQREAAIALGCTPAQAFFKVVMPQAMRHFIPIYKGEIINLVKLTSVVGFIAVQDLTKVSDIIRSRTFDAFIPLSLSAVIYIILALILIWIVNLIFRKTDPRNRSREKILAGTGDGKEGTV